MVGPRVAAAIRRGFPTELAFAAASFWLMRTFQWLTKTAQNRTDVPKTEGVGVTLSQRASFSATHSLNTLMRSTKWILFFWLGSLAAGCAAPVTFGGFDLEAWREDKFGCKEKRIGQLVDFETIVKPELLKGDLREMQIKELLGLPDQIEVAERGQKFYIYFLEPGSQCKSSTHPDPARHVRMRFNATSQVNEVTLVDLRK